MVTCRLFPPVPLYPQAVRRVCECGRDSPVDCRNAGADWPSGVARNAGIDLDSSVPRVPRSTTRLGTGRAWKMQLNPCHAEGADSPAEAEKAVYSQSWKWRQYPRESPSQLANRLRNQEEKSQQHGNHVPGKQPPEILPMPQTPPAQEKLYRADRDHTSDERGDHFCFKRHLYLLLFVSGEMCRLLQFPFSHQRSDFQGKVEAAGAAVLGLLHGKPGQDEAPTVGAAEMAQFDPPKGGCRSNSHGQEHQAPVRPGSPPARHKSKTAANSVPLAAEYHFCSSFIVPAPSVNNPQIPLPQLPVQRQ